MAPTLVRPIDDELWYMGFHKNRSYTRCIPLKTTQTSLCPVKITNISLYEECNEKPISITIFETQWRLLGHIMRRNIEIPANMEAFFVP